MSWAAAAADRPRRALFLSGVILLIAAGTLVTGALTPRDLSMGEAAMELAQGDLPAFVVSRWISGLVLALCAGSVFVAVFGRRLPRAGTSIWIAYMFFVLLNFAIPGIAGTQPGIDVRYFYPAIVATGICFARRASPGQVRALIKVVLSSFVFAGLLAAVAMPDRALAANYSGLLPFLDVRLYGIGGGAASLGAQAAALLAVEIVAPLKSSLRYAYLLPAAVVLVLTQAKAAWAYILLGATYWLARTLSRRLFRGPAKSASMARLGIVAISLAGLGALAAVYGGEAVRRLASIDENINTFTGRTWIWEATLGAWRGNVLFGYGVGLWVDDSFRSTYGGFMHAHNQFLHSLGSAGLVGLLGLLAYFWVCWKASLRAARTDKVPLALFLLVLAQALTEVPLRNEYLLDSYTLLHLLLVASLVHVTAPNGSAPTEARAAVL